MWYLILYLPKYIFNTTCIFFSSKVNWNTKTKWNVQFSLVAISILKKSYHIVFIFVFFKWNVKINTDHQTFTAYIFFWKPKWFHLSMRVFYHNWFWWKIPEKMRLSWKYYVNTMKLYYFAYFGLQKYLKLEMFK